MARGDSLARQFQLFMLLDGVRELEVDSAAGVRARSPQREPPLLLIGTGVSEGAHWQRTPRLLVETRSLSDSQRAKHAPRSLPFSAPSVTSVLRRHTDLPRPHPASFRRSKCTLTRSPDAHVGPLALSSTQ